MVLDCGFFCVIYELNPARFKINTKKMDEVGSSIF
jgi:hypothetical protein